MNDFSPEKLFTLEKTVAAEIFDGVENVWEVLPKIGDFIVKLGNSLSPEKFDKAGENIWIAKSATVAPSADITGPCIIDENAEIRHCAYIRGKAIIGKNSVVGNSSELKNVIIFDDVQVPHYNYVGDSVLGTHAHMGAGAITSNIKSDRTNVTINRDGEKIATGLRKVGAFLGDYVEVGCSGVLNPGTVIGKHTSVYPLTMVRGYIPENSILKNNGEIVSKE